MDGKQFHAVTVQNAGILSTDTEGLTLATLASIGEKMRYLKVSADAMANTATAETVIGEFPAVVGRIISVKFLPSAALTGDATNNAVLTVRRRPAAGGAAVSLATLTTTASWTAFVAASLTVSNVSIVASDVITFEISKGGTGVAVPSGVLEIQFVRSDDINSLTQWG